MAVASFVGALQHDTETAAVPGFVELPFACVAAGCLRCELLRLFSHLRRVICVRHAGACSGQDTSHYNASRHGDIGAAASAVVLSLEVLEYCRIQGYRGCPSDFGTRKSNLEALSASAVGLQPAQHYASSILDI